MTVRYIRPKLESFSSNLFCFILFHSFFFFNSFVLKKVNWFVHLQGICGDLSSILSTLLDSNLGFDEIRLFNHLPPSGVDNFVFNCGGAHQAKVVCRNRLILIFINGRLYHSRVPRFVFISGYKRASGTSRRK